jgi:putative effector of murein hydrolase
VTAELAAAALTLAAFFGCRWLARQTGGHPLANPVLLAALTVGVLLWTAGIRPKRYTDAAAPLVWMLGPAIVALASVVYRSRSLLRARAVALLAAVVAGSLTGTLSAVALARLFGLDPALTKALAAKSVTSPFAIELMHRLGGSAELAAGLVIMTGIIGAILLPPVLRRLDLPEGAAMGQAAHIVGTDALARRDAGLAAEAALVMVLAGVVTSVLLPLLWPLLHSGR